MHPTDPAEARRQHERLAASLLQLREGQLSVAQFSALAQAQTELAAALPARFGEVLVHLLNRLESSALFTEESCSFSQSDLLDSMRSWLDQAGLHLDKT
jgi:hypothetical protein